MKLFKTSMKYGSALALSAYCLAASAETDWTPLTDAVDFGDLALKLITIAVAVMGIVIVIKGIQWIIARVKGA